MSENIKVSEVSDILRHQLEGIDTRVQLDEIGTVLQVSDGVARIYGLRNYIPFGIPDISYMDQFVIFCHLISSRAIFRVSGG